ncbi:MAG TPA: CHRD domain-containing protein [Gemmatimonadaceae bacterium]
MKRLFAFSVAVAGIGIAAACGSDDPSTPAGTVTAVAITGAPASFAVSRTATLTANVTVTNSASQAVTWTSSNAGVVSISPSGGTATITAVAVGNATITATSTADPTKSATAQVSVLSRTVSLGATMTPGGEPPGLLGNPTGSGTYSATLDTVTNVFSWTGTFTGLTTNVNNGHIHGPFVPGGTATTATVLLNFNPSSTPGATFVGLGSATSGSVSGSVTLNAAFISTSTINGDSLRKLILAGATYVNIHTVQNGGGEIRGQLTRK